MIRSVSINRLALTVCGCLAVGVLGTGCKGLLHSQVVQCPPPATVTASGLDMQDLRGVAIRAVGSLSESGIFDRAPNHPAVLASSSFSNHTSQQVDMSLLTGEVRVALLQTGKVVLTAVEPQAAESSLYANTLSRPDFVLSGRVFQTIVRTGRSRQSSYVFQFSLSDSNRLAVWEENVTITKQSKKSPALL